MNTNNKSLNDLLSFLGEHTVETGKPLTHTSIHNPCGKYYIKNTELDLFYDLYEKALFDNNDLHLTEQHEEISPLIIDLDFKYEFDTHERKHNEQYIKNIVELYIKEIVNLFQIERNDPRLTSFVFERKNLYKIRGITKDGIHILFPFIISTPNPFYYIRDNILKKIGDVLTGLDFKNVISDVVDRSVISPNVMWLLYGSNKDKPKGDPYLLTYVFDGNSEKAEIENYFDFENHPTNLVKFFSIRNKRESDMIQVRTDKMHLLDNNVKKKSLKGKLSAQVNYDIDKIKELYTILSDDRADNYGEWLDLGFATHSIDPNSVELLEIWENFSRKSPKFKEGECEKIWDKMKDGGLTVASIYYWAKSDNYQKYMEFKNKDINKFIDVSIKTQANYDVAYVLFKMFEYDFVYSEGDWYHYRNHRWNREPDGYALRQLISTRLVEEYGKKISSFNVQQSSSDITEEEKEEFKKKGKTILDLVVKLKTTSFKDNIMKESKELFNNKDFVKKLDSNPFILGFTNGVYDLKKGELRNGRPDDYLMMTTEIEKVDFDENNEHWPDLKHFLETIFYQEEIRDYFMTYLASCLQGHNAEEKFRVWNGRGSNGKSKLLELFVHSLGSYSIKFNVTLLTGKRAASNACSPELVRAKGCRFGYLEEPGENERIDVGFLKELTGGDKITARGLCKDPIDFKPQFKLALLCNEIPKVPPTDSGTWRRMEVIEFKSQFVENPKEVGEFIIDKSLSQKMTFWKELFMAMLLDKYYENYKKNGMTVPEEIINFTNEYQRTCDLYADFIIENIEETRENTDSIDIAQFYDEFKMWYEDSFNNHKYPSKMEFKKYLRKRYGTKRVSQTDIKGFKFRIKYDKQGNPIPLGTSRKSLESSFIEPTPINIVNSPLVNTIATPKSPNVKNIETKIEKISEPIVNNDIIEDNEEINDNTEEIIDTPPQNNVINDTPDVETMAGY